MRLRPATATLTHEVLDGGTSWPSAEDDPAVHRLATDASDHRLLGLDLRWPATGR